MADTAASTAPVPVIVRYGAMGLVGEFSYNGAEPLLHGMNVVVISDRGMEIGQVLALCCKGPSWAVGPEQVSCYVQRSGAENCKPRVGKILRPASRADLDEAAHMAGHQRAMMEYAQKRADETSLGMRFIGVEHIFGGERAIFYFESENRVDFRNLVKELAHEYQTRIEMRQIGARDEARLLADYEICGRQCCCKNFLKSLKPVSMRMAKVQKATLDPTKVSGRCGRLRCCLRYEQETYEALDRKLPPMNSRVRIKEGVGVVIDRQILTQLLAVFIEPDGPRQVVPVEDVLELNVKSPPPPAGEQARDNGGPAGPQPNGNGRRGNRNNGRGGRPPARPEESTD